MSSETAEPAPAPAPEAPAPGASSPGAIIREARTRARMSVEELAAATKLARPTLEALERDDFNALQEAVYVRGYYRKCAKILGLNEAELVAVYQNRVVPKRPDPPAKLRLASGTEIGEVNRLPVPMAVVSAAAAVVIGILLWNLFKTPGDSTPVIPLPEQSIQVELPPSEPAPLASDAPPAVAAPGAPTTTVPQDPAAATPTPAPATAPSPPVAPAATPAPAAPMATLSLNFTSQSWARIEDASGKTLLNGLIREGESPVLRGQAPFSVFLGNGPGVEIQFGGKPVDFSQHVRDNLTASFRVPAGSP